MTTDRNCGKIRLGDIVQSRTRPKKDQSTFRQIHAEVGDVCVHVSLRNDGTGKLVVLKSGHTVVEYPWSAVERGN